LSDSTKICGLIGIATKAGKIVAGTDACIEEMQRGKVKLVLVARDASERTKKTFEEEAKKYQITIYTILTIEELSKAIGKVNKAVIGIRDIGFSKKMISIINGGEVIG
jgi:ribosomal protein L7Ae-like RNA K-turn-binding protein